MERHKWEPGDWTVTVNEVSMGVYEIGATSPTLGEIRVKTAELDAALKDCRRIADDRAKREDVGE